MENSSLFRFPTYDADLILVTEESRPQSFYVHQNILSMASPFFKDMLSLPQPPSDSKALPRIPVAESARTLELLLQFVYPVPDPAVTSLDDLAPVIAAAHKYDFVAILSSLRRILVTPEFLEKNPARVFAIATRFEFEEEAKLSSRYTLKENLLEAPLNDDLHHLSAYSYHQLLHLHRRRAVAAQNLLNPPENLKCMQCNGYGYGAFGTPKWWQDFQQRAKEELAQRPTTDVIFSMKFLAQSATTGCPRCPLSLLDAAEWLERLKHEMDSLPVSM
ncbi:hypothetical protein AX16_006228 [Volvariella volvacea WC 439]|nr:hypothetical protein AX16_006228 [Volvariella volvacea WC 439]